MFYGHKKMWGNEAWEPLGDLAEWNPRARTAPAAVTVCYATLNPYHIISTYASNASKSIFGDTI